MINEKQIIDFCDYVQNLIDTDIDEHHPVMRKAGKIPEITYSMRREFTKVIYNSSHGVTQKVYAFIDMENGDVLCPTNFNDPDESSRSEYGNLNHEDTAGTTYCGPYSLI